MPLKIVATEKALVEQAYDLRAELENTAADVFGLFSKIGVYLHTNPSHALYCRFLHSLFFLLVTCTLNH